MASKKKLTATPSEARLTRGRARDAASSPAAPTKANLPATYSATLAEIKQCVRQSRLRTVLAANAAMVTAYWEIGRVILDRQQAEGWGAKVIDRLSSDLREAFPDMRGLSPRNLKYMRSFAAAWPDAAIVQGTLAQIGWYQNIALLDKLTDAPPRLWYAQQAAEHGWSQAPSVWRNGRRTSPSRCRRSCPEACGAPRRLKRSWPERSCSQSHARRTSGASPR